MEKLLNKLLGMGRKPRGLDRIKGGIIYCGPKGGITFQCKGSVIDFCCPDYVLYNGEKYMDYDDYLTYYDDSVIIDTKHIFGYRKLLRELCSKESLLWQFVCENGMIRNEHYCWDGYIHGDDNGRIEIWQVDYRYRLIESALCDEDKLEDFLLNSIKLG